MYTVYIYIYVYDRRTIDQQGNLIPPNQPIQTSEVSEEVVQTSALPSNINQDTGLTSTEEALLSPSEKALRRKQRNVIVYGKR